MDPKSFCFSVMDINDRVLEADFFDIKEWQRVGHNSALVFPDPEDPVRQKILEYGRGIFIGSKWTQFGSADFKTILRYIDYAIEKRNGPFFDSLLDVYLDLFRSKFQLLNEDRSNWVQIVCYVTD
jgi:hypothetical protein